MKRLKARTAQKAKTKTKTNPAIVRRKPFAADEIQKYVNPGSPDEAEKFVRLIYAERRQD